MPPGRRHHKESVRHRGGSVTPFCWASVSGRRLRARREPTGEISRCPMTPEAPARNISYHHRRPRLVTMAGCTSSSCWPQRVISAGAPIQRIRFEIRHEPVRFIDVHTHRGQAARRGRCSRRRPGSVAERGTLTVEHAGSGAGGETSTSAESRLAAR